ncbi:MAG: cytochrome c3 family protein [bacterium]
MIGVIKVKPGVAFFLILTAAALPPRPAAALETIQHEEGSTCVVCHGDKETSLNGSIHAHFGLDCVSCHGGDDTQVEWEKAMDPAKGFKGAFTAKEVLFLCDRCHGDYERMRQFGIAIDQLQQYRTSEHGKALFLTGNEKVAVCTSCHGVHDIKKVTDPESSVYPTNVPGTCAKCHSDPGYMKPFNVSTTVVEDYKKGVHGKRLLQMDLAAPTCATCHGNHGAAPPGVAEVVNVCGKCHLNIREEFKKSRHFRKGLECVNCHNNHANVHPTKAIFSRKDPGGCRHCHPDADSKQGKYISRILNGIREAEQALEKAEKNTERAEYNGFYVDNEKVLLQEGRTAFLQFANVQHALSLREGTKVLSTAVSKAMHVNENVEIKFRTITDRRITMSAVIGYLLAVLALVYVKYRGLKAAYTREKNRAS